MKIGKEVFEDLIKQCCVSDWFGLSQCFDLNKFLTLAERRGLIGDVWDKKVKELLLTTYRAYALRNQATEEAIDKDLRLIAEKLCFDLVELRRLYYFGLEPEPSESATTENPTMKTPEESPSREEIERALEDVEGEEE